MLDKMLLFIADRLGKLLGVTKTQSFTFNGKTFMFRKIGAIVYLDASADIQGIPQGVSMIGTLDADMRPNYTQRYRAANDVVAENRFLGVEPDGKVYIYSSVAKTGATNNSFSGFAFIARGGGTLRAVFPTLSALSERRWEHVRQNTEINRRVPNKDNDNNNNYARSWDRRLLCYAIWESRSCNGGNKHYNGNCTRGRVYQRTARAKGRECVIRDGEQQHCIGVYKLRIFEYIERWFERTGSFRWKQPCSRESFLQTFYGLHSVVKPERGCLDC